MYGHGNGRMVGSGEWNLVYICVCVGVSSMQIFIVCIACVFGETWVPTTGNVS